MDRADGDAVGAVPLGRGHELTERLEIAESAVAFAAERVKLDGQRPGPAHVRDRQPVLGSDGQGCAAAAGFERVIASLLDRRQRRAAGRSLEHAAPVGAVFKDQLIRAGLDRQARRRVHQRGNERREVSPLGGQRGAALRDLGIVGSGEAQRLQDGPERVVTHLLPFVSIVLPARGDADRLCESPERAHQANWAIKLRGPSAVGSASPSV